MKKELLKINEMVKGDEIAEKIMSDLLDVYYKRERIGEFRKKLIHFSNPLLNIIAAALFLLMYLVLLFNNKQEIVFSWLWKNQYSWLFL